jgi:hypothetical protein
MYVLYNSDFYFYTEKEINLRNVDLHLEVDELRISVARQITTQLVIDKGIGTIRFNK